MKKKYYVIADSIYNGAICNIKSFEGYQFLPKNTIHYNGVVVNSLLVMKPSFIEKLLKKKNQRRLDYYLQFLMESADDETDSGKLGKILNDLTKYQNMIDYKYRKYLDDQYIDLLLKKVMLLEQELKTKLVYQQWKTYTPPVYANPVYEEEKKGKAR